MLQKFTVWYTTVFAKETPYCIIDSQTTIYHLYQYHYFILICLIIFTWGLSVDYKHPQSSFNL